MTSQPSKDAAVELSSAKVLRGAVTGGIINGAIQ